MNQCWFQRIYPHRCEGRIQRCHFIPNQRIKAAGGRDVSWDPRIWRWGCDHIHRRIDGFNALNKIALPFESYPTSVLEFADEQGWTWLGKREGWVKSA